MSMSKPFFASLSALIASAVLVPGTGYALADWLRSRGIEPQWFAP